MKSEYQKYVKQLNKIQKMYDDINHSNYNSITESLYCVCNELIDYIEKDIGDTLHITSLWINELDFGRKSKSIINEDTYKENDKCILDKYILEDTLDVWLAIQDLKENQI